MLWLYIKQIITYESLWNYIICDCVSNSLKTLLEESYQKSISRWELARQIEKFLTIFIGVFWNSFLECFNSAS